MCLCPFTLSAVFARQHLKLNPLNLVDCDLVFGPVIKFGGPGRLRGGHVLGMLESASVLQVNGHTGRAPSVTSDRRQKPRVPGSFCGWPVDLNRECAVNNSPSDRNPLDFIERDFVIAAIVELGCPRRFVVSDLLRYFQLAAVLQIGRDAGRAEAMIANPRFDTGRFRAPADDAVRVLLEEGIGCKLTSLAAGGPEEIAFNVIANASRFNIVVQILLQTMMTRDVVLLTAFFV